MDLSECPVKVTVDVIGGKWKPMILFFLKNGRKRFSQLQHDISRVTQKTLTQQLRQLERDGVVAREVFASVPPRVEYSLTTYGETLRPILEQMCKWGNRHRRREIPTPGYTVPQLSPVRRRRAEDAG